MAAIERHWYGIGPYHLLLIPASWLFRMLSALRRFMYKSGMLGRHRLPVPVIVIGNISAGGTGKTPLTLAIARRLTEEGHHPVIVSRGYGGSGRMQQVAHGATAAEVGDEPLLMARRNICPVWVGQDRAAAARLALQSYPECDVLLCDDGLQHYRLMRDVEVAVVDGARRFGNGQMLPAGPLREPLSRLKSVDAVVVNGGAAEPGQYAMRLSGDVFYNLAAPDRTAIASDLRHLRLHAVAGIGNPRRFFDHLRAMDLGFTEHAFADHHPYLKSDLAFDACDALLLTEKDAVKCAPFADERYWVLRVDALIDPALIDLILRKIALHGRKTA